MMGKLKSGDILKKSFVELFEERVALTPNVPALLCDERVVTYGDLNAMANQWAWFLLRQGVRIEDRVALCVQRSVEMIAALLAVIKAGGAYLPLDPAWPEARRRAILKDSRARLLFTDRAAPELAAGFAGGTIVLERDRRQLHEHSTANPGVLTKPENLLAAIYTSGSTGAAKGVLVTIKPVLNRLVWLQQAYPFREGDVTLLHRSYSFIGFTTIDCFPSLLGGVPLAIVPAAETGDPVAIYKRAMKFRASHAAGSPGFWEAILDYIDGHRPDWSTLRLAMVGGEPLHLEIVRRWRRAFPRVPLINVYGGTEFSSAAACDTAALHVDSDGLAPAGLPMPNAQVYVLDKNMCPAAMGETAEIYVAGDCLARGYLNRPALTAERFVPHPGASNPGDRFLRTGDLGFWRADGGLQVVGRCDHVVNVRGFRVELEEVEEALCRCPGARSAVVLSHEKGPGDTRLVGYVVKERDSECSPETLRLFLLRHVPSYMVPSRFVMLEQMPVTATGKIDRLALSRMAGGEDIATGTVSPRTGTEQVVAEIFCAVLGRDTVDVEDDFFALGGHSLLGMQILLRINGAVGVDLSLQRLFDTPTVRGLATLIDSLSSTESVLTDPQTDE